MLRATYARADEGFLNPFGATVTPGSQRADASVEMKVTKSARAKFSFMDERNHTANVDNSRETASLLWTESFGDRLRATFGYDFRSFKDDLSGRQTDSNLVTVGAEYKATAKLSLSAKREQNLTDADPTYPPSRRRINGTSSRNSSSPSAWPPRPSCPSATPPPRASPPPPRATRRRSASRRSSVASPT
ncbi:MAG: hypothetical protein DMF66_12460 [Acidobacteria bacterium]|nr:MAG: hypothetical protein DMF66_12460 [Acidobacteriota bacterium]